MSKHPSETFCILPWMHLSTRPNGHMRVCCTANASSVGPTNDKEFGGEVGISTNKLPPRGPVGLEQLVSYKYEVFGQGQIRK